MIVKNKDDLILVHIPNARELIARTRIMEALEKGSISSRPLLVPLTMNKIMYMVRLSKDRHPLLRN